MVLSLFGGQVHFHRSNFAVNVENAVKQWKKLQNLFPHSNQGFLIEFIKAFFKNINVLPICPGRINLRSHLKGLTTLFSLCGAGWVPLNWAS
jgi:hypothetical protein